MQLIWTWNIKDRTAQVSLTAQECYMHSRQQMQKAYKLFFSLKIYSEYTIYVQQIQEKAFAVFQVSTEEDLEVKTHL